LKYLLDTNVLSEPASAVPNARALAWIAAQDPLDLHVSVVTLAEIEEGVARLSASRRRAALETWRDSLAVSLGDRLLPLDAAIASTWGRLRARLAAERRTIAPMDGFIAATAERHDLTLVTRNVKQFQARGGAIVDPWSET
jgi:predicted nucleic acid-binding protein